MSGLTKPATGGAGGFTGSGLGGPEVCWNLDEAGGARADSCSTLTLTDNNTVGNRTGPTFLNSVAADFIRTNNEFLSRPSVDSEMNFGDSIVTCCAHVRLDDLTDQQHPFSFAGGVAGGGSGWEIRFRTATGNTFRFNLIDSTVTVRSVTSLLSIDVDAWYPMRWGLDPATDEAFIQVGGEALVTLAIPDGGLAVAGGGADPLQIGRRNAINTSDFDGGLALAAKYARRWTDQEWDLYRSGVLPA